jgi:hypothetical protein
VVIAAVKHGIDPGRYFGVDPADDCKLENNVAWDKDMKMAAESRNKPDYEVANELMDDPGIEVAGEQLDELDGEVVGE